jgi:hypothetical protein
MRASSPKPLIDHAMLAHQQIFFLTCLCKHSNTSIMRERNTSPRCQLQYNLIVACNAIVTTIPW